MDMKTLADFKREMIPGTRITCNGVEEAGILDQDFAKMQREELRVVPLSEKMQGTRTITKADTTGFYLSHTPEDGKRGSFCGFPKASELFYDGTVFTVTEKDHHGQVWQRRHYTVAR